MSLATILAILSKIPFVAGIVKKFTGKGRLFLEYLLLAAFVVMCGLVLSLWITRAQTRHELAKTNQRLDQTSAQLTTVQTRLTQTEQVNREQQSTIKDLRDLRETDGRAVSALMQSFAEISKKDADTRNKLRQLEETNEDVKVLLHQRIPPELACLLNGTPCPAAARGQDGGGVPHPARPAAPAVRRR